MKKGISCKVEVLTNSIFIIVMALGLVIGGYTFAMGFHELDRGFNLLMLNELYDMSFYEVGFQMFTGKITTSTSTELINSGYKKQNIGLGLLCFSWLLVGILMVETGSIIVREYKVRE
jgi:hypothetical protein